jgi:hypothetical protein
MSSFRTKRHHDKHDRPGRVTIKMWPDGSQSLHVVRSFIPDDPRLPIELGAGTAYYAPDGNQTRSTGAPIHLIGPDGGRTRSMPDC